MPNGQTATVIQKSTQSRIFMIEGGAGPANEPEYMSLGRALAFSQSFGDVTPVRIPSRNSYGQFETVDTIQGQAELPQMGVEFRKQRAISMLYRIAKKRCAIDLHINIGDCKNPQDYDRGFDVCGILEQAFATNYSTDEMGAMDADQNAPVNETEEFTALAYYEIAPVTAQKLGDSIISDEIIAIVICDSETCASCGIESDGCSVVFALQAESSGSPGIGAKVIWTKDAGANMNSSNVVTTSIGETVTSMACVGPYLVVGSGGSNDRFHYCLIADLIKGTANWKTVTTGVVAAGSPLYMYSYDAQNTYITGDAGYLYKMVTPARGVVPLMSGSPSTSALRSVHTLDNQTILVGGDSNTLLLSRNQGQNFATLTGPTAMAGINVRSVTVHAQNTFFVTYANGSVYYTVDAGVNWTACVLSIALNDARAISFATRSVGYLVGQDGNNAGRILRTINGGYTWVEITEVQPQVMPTSRNLTCVAACSANPQISYYGGLATDLNDGVFIKAA